MTPENKAKKIEKQAEMLRKNLILRKRQIEERQKRDDMKKNKVPDAAKPDEKA